MKPVLAWVKSNVLIVVFSALIVLMLPSAWFVSTWWDKKILTKQEKEAGEAYKKLETLRIDYALPSYESGAQPVLYKEAPNMGLITWFKNERENLGKQAGVVTTRAEQFNMGVGADAAGVGRSEHKPLVEGLLPNGGQDKLNDMEDTLLGKRGLTNPYATLLASIRAGDAADASKMAEEIATFRSSETNKITGTRRELTPEEQASLMKQLVEQRLGQVQGAARAVSVYANMDSLPHDPRGAFIPTGTHLDQQRLNLSDMFLFQWDYWVLRDVVDAIKLANTADGKLTNVDRSVIKRIERISISVPEAFGRGGESGQPAWQQPGQAAPAPVAAGPGAMAPLDLNTSLTGRRAENSVYDTRTVTISLIVNSARLADVAGAFERTNFMTVTDMDLSEVNVWDDLARGYYYGPDHVVRATLEVETVWLRSWMTKYMPAKVRETLKVPADVPAPDAPPAAAPPPG